MGKCVLKDERDFFNRYRKLMKVTFKMLLATETKKRRPPLYMDWVGNICVEFYY